MRALLVLFLFCASVAAGEPLTPDWCKDLPRAAYKGLEKIEVSDPWFEVYKIRPGIFAIYEGKQYEEVISYLIAGKERALLFDTGMGIASIRKVVSDLTSLSVIVLNSHTHPDHVGGNAEFPEIWGVNTKFTLVNAAGYSDPEMRAWVQPDHICGALPQDFHPDSYRVRPFEIKQFVEDGEQIDLGDRTLEVIFTPGHTPDSLCLLDRANRLLFTGDTFYLGPIYLYSSETDFDAYTRSIARLKKLKSSLDLLLPAHNVPVASTNYLDQVADAVSRIAGGKITPRQKDGLREYEFDGFSMILGPAAKKSSHATEPSRDPFSEMKGDRFSSVQSSKIPQTLSVAYVLVIGITKSERGYIALLKGANGKTYFMKTGDRLFDGAIQRITSESVTFLPDHGSPVTKKLHPVPE